MQAECVNVAEEEISSMDCNDNQKRARQNNFMVYKRIYHGLIIHAGNIFWLNSY